MLMRKEWKVAIIILIVAFGYAILRYNVIKGVVWEHLPLFIANKTISLSAVALIALSYTLGALGQFWPKTFTLTLNLRKFFGLFGFGLAAIHAFISLLIFTPTYYPKFFQGPDQLNLTGELSMLFGVLAFFIFAIVALTSLPQLENTMGHQRWLALQRLGYLGLLLVLFHVSVMSFKGWLHPEK